MQLMHLREAHTLLLLSELMEGFFTMRIWGHLVTIRGFPIHNIVFAGVRQ